MKSIYLTVPGGGLAPIVHPPPDYASVNIRGSIRKIRRSLEGKGKYKSRREGEVEGNGGREAVGLK